MPGPKHDIVAHCLDLVRPAENAFRSRWRLSTLQRLDGELHAAVVEQVDLYNAALVTGSDGEARMQAEAMVRGWRAACQRMEAPLQPDDAYLLGWDYNTGTRVVISDEKGALARAQSLHGEKVLLVTPDEVARMMAGMEILASAKAAFPDAELLGLDAA